MNKEDKVLNSFASLDYIPAPKRTFNIGEEVYIEGAETATITDIIFDGKFLEVEFKTSIKQANVETKNAGQAWDEMLADAFDVDILPDYKFFQAGEKVTDVFPWFQIYKKEPQADKTLFDKQMKITAYITTIRNLLNKAYFNGINFEPDYQRGLVWDLEDKQKLIESVKDGVNLGLFVFATLRSDASEGPCFEIADGKQRLTTLKEYFEDGFQVDGFYFSDLTPFDRRRFLDHTVEMVNLGVNAGKNRKFILKSFLTLNRSGKKISEEHMAYVEELYNQAEEYKSTQYTIKKQGS